MGGLSFRGRLTPKTDDLEKYGFGELSCHAHATDSNNEPRTIPSGRRRWRPCAEGPSTAGLLLQAFY